MDSVVKTYPNGLRLVVTPMANYKSVAFSISVMVGSGDETKDEQGLSHFCEHMLFKGTTNRTGQQIIDEFSRLGIINNAWTSECETRYHAKTVAENLEACVDIMSDMYLNTKFEVGDFHKEGDVIVQEIAMHEDNPGSVMYDRMNEVFYRGTKYEHPVAGYAAAIKQYQPDDIYNYLEKHYIAPKTVIAFAGDVTVERAEELVSKYFLRYLPKTAAEPMKRQNVAPVQPASSSLQVKKDTEQQHVVLALPVCNQYSDERYALRLFSLLYGGDMSSRLFINVREKLGLVYSIHCGLEFSDIGGNLMVVFSCTPQNTQKVIDVIYKEIDDLRRNGIQEEELAKARNYYHVQRLFQSEVTTSVNNHVADVLLDYDRVITTEEELIKVDAVTVEEINALIKKYLSKERIITVVVGK